MPQAPVGVRCSWIRSSLAEDQGAGTGGDVGKAFDKAAGAMIRQRQMQPQPGITLRQLAAQGFVAHPDRLRAAKQEAEDQTRAAFQHGLLVQPLHDGFVTAP